MFRPAEIKPYVRQPGDPAVRPLRIFTLDPATSKLDGAVDTIDVPFETVSVGPVGALFKVDNLDGGQNQRYRQVDLNDPAVLLRQGHDPSPSDPRFHQQMVYAVSASVYEVFRRALGRELSWAFDRSVADTSPQLILRPHAFEGSNAHYDKSAGEVCFGYYRAGAKVTGRNLPGGYVFTCLSHDVIAHEVAHALIDGQRSHFIEPTGLDALAFHEAFADLVAIFQHFRYPTVVKQAISRSPADPFSDELLTSIARQFGHTTNEEGGPLRSYINADSSDPAMYKEYDSPHELGSVLVSAVFEAFITVYKRKTKRYISLATRGTGILEPGDLPATLQELLAEEASKLAGQFLTMCIRAVDYCPPVDITFGEYLRAVITADRELVPDDPWGYREAWVDAFRRRGIYPRDVANLSEDSLVWRPPRQALPRIKALSFGQIEFVGDPGHSVHRKELARQAEALGTYISKPEYTEAFGLKSVGQSTAMGPPNVESIRSLRRIGPDGQVVFELVAEIVQQQSVKDAQGREHTFYGGSTVILDPDGSIRLVVLKNIASEERQERQQRFMTTSIGKQFWRVKNARWSPALNVFMSLHKAAPNKKGGPS